ncbi:radical SAM protein [Candidatus Micrarchaeota archaeon]|nr:radical SAM protein [Candidatus Micrarchaeota archaeon]
MGKTRLQAQRAPGKILYSFSTPQQRGRETLYVNSVGNYACINSCRFCGRKAAMEGRPNIYEKKAGGNLYLPRAPLAEDILPLAKERIRKRMPDEIVFVGLGEPLLNFPAVCDSIRGLRAFGYSGEISLNTNGAVARWGNMPAQLKGAGLDSVRISVNAVNNVEYNKLCRPKDKDAFLRVCRFLQECAKCGIEVFASFVVGFEEGKIKTKPFRHYRAFALMLGVELPNILRREYVPPTEELQ